jgi:photosystem II stability/assembly factor-like uncharacterized protein
MADLLLGPGGAPAGDLRPDDLNWPAKPGRRRAVIAVVAALAVAAGGVWLTHVRRPSEPAAARPPATDPADLGTPASGESSAPIASAQGNTLQVRYADADNGFALVGYCDPRSDRLCGYQLRVTADGGRSWQTRRVPLPAVPRDGGFSAELFVFGTRSLLVRSGGPQSFSPDGGLSWRAAPPSAGSALASVPAGWTTVSTCPDRTDALAPCYRPVAALDPTTGRRHVLVNQPRLAGGFINDRATTAHDGSIWVAGTEPGNARPAVAVSRDQGRSWRTVPLAAPNTPLFGVSLVTHDGRTAYAFVRAQGHPGDGVKNGLASVWRTNDGGRNWQRVGSAGQPRSLLGVALLPDDRLLITTEEFGGTNLRYSADGGRTFPVWPSAAPSLGWIEEVAGRYVAGGLYGGHLASTDGRRWTPIPASG